MRKRKICFLITSHIHYARNKLLMEHIKKDKSFDLQIIVAGSALLQRFGNVEKLLKKDGFTKFERLYTTLEGGNNEVMAKTMGISILEFTNAFERLNPDIVVLRGDRYEILAGAISAAYTNKMIAHIEGGDVSGSIDESVRHAITKLSHLHFPTNEDAYNRLIQMGENPKYVHNVGSIDVEFIDKVHVMHNFEFIKKAGVGYRLNGNKPFLMVIQHSVTTGENNLKNIEETIKAVHDLDIQALWFWPNVDAGTDDISKALRVYRENNKKSKIKFIRYLSPEQFASFLKRTSCLVGNSSAGIKETSYLGIPVVNIGTRQQDRVSVGSNMINVDYDHLAIKKAIRKQLKHGQYQGNNYYYQKDTSKKMHQLLKNTPLITQKHFYQK